MHPDRVTSFSEPPVSGPLFFKASHAAGTVPGLGLLVLFGSRARGDASDRSDWDFGYLGDPGTERAELFAALAEVLGTDRVDVADLERSTALLRFRVARDGVPVFESSQGRFLRFQEEASLAWCDMESVLRSAYGRVLDDLVQG